MAELDFYALNQIPGGAAEFILIRQ